MTDYGLRIADCGLRISGLRISGLRIADSKSGAVKAEAYAEMFRTIM